MITIEQIRQLVALMRAGQLQTLETCENASSILLVLADTHQNANLDGLKQANLTFIKQADFLQALIMLMHECGISCIKINDASRQYHLVLADTPALATQATSVTATATIASLAASELGIYAPMTGVFYQAQAPGAEPFVAVGAAVTCGDIVCIIESMKMMNPLPSEHTGAIAAIHVDNGQAITEGQRLFTLTP